MGRCRAGLARQMLDMRSCLECSQAVCSAQYFRQALVVQSLKKCPIMQARSSCSSLVRAAKDDWMASALALLAKGSGGAAPFQLPLLNLHCLLAPSSLPSSSGRQGRLTCTGCVYDPAIGHIVTAAAANDAPALLSHQTSSFHIVKPRV